MCKKNQVIITIVLSFLILSPIISTDWTVNEIPDLENDSNVANVFIESLLEDPFFKQPQEVIVNGTSEEFSSEYHASSGSNDVSYIDMDWSHTENTALDFRGVDPEEIFPDYYDFIYTYQDFEFPYEVTPDEAQISFNYSVYLTGDFVAGVQENNNLMFRVYVWVIDSSGNWYRIYESREDVYVEEYQQQYLNLNYFDLIDIFNGMIEVDGVQEDPTDSATLAIGLAPTYRFENFAETEPWTFYDGSVSVRVSYADVYVIMDIPNDPSTFWQPTYNETYGITVGDVFPLYENATDEVLDECYGMKVGPDGSVYVTGNSRAFYELSLQGYYFRHQFLLKYNPSLDLLWEVKNDNMTQVRSMYIQGGYIYTTGYIEREDTGRNLIVTKWSDAGEKVWQKEWGGEFTQVGIAVGVKDNGSIYVICSDYYDDFPGYYHRTQILNFDNNGNFLWNKTTQYMFAFHDESGDIYMFDDFFEFSPNSGIGFGGRYYFNGTESFWSFGQVFVPDGEGGAYGAFYADQISQSAVGTAVHLVHYTSAAFPYIQTNHGWHTNYSETWPNGWGSYLRPRNIITTPDDKIHLLIQQTTLSLDYLLLTYDLDGNLLENRTIGDENWPYFTVPIFMEVGNAGQVYFAFTIYNSPYMLYEVCIQSYEMYEVESIFTLTVTTVIIIASTVVIIGATVSIVRRKRTS